jgi:superfamily II DNA or RNA helicase
MRGAKQVAGEWSQKESTSRGIKLTGDIVSEWVKKTHEVFGKPEKTIVFCAGVAHGIDLQTKFQEQGFNFISISYKDDDDFKRDIIEDFNKPDSNIIGLIATDILTKGFDSPSVRIGVSARPFSKSLSSHVQQMGRVMRPYPGKTFGLWLDHSGNYLRFRKDWDDVFENGVTSLDDGKEKAKKEPEELEKKESKCPACGALWPKGSDTCAHCGHVRERKSMVSSVPGEMQELAGKSKVEGKQAWWSMAQWKVQAGSWSEKRALANYREKFGEWPRNLNDTPLYPSGAFESFAIKSIRRYLKGGR